MNCVNCGTETSNPKFCSKSCSAKFTNKTPKRKKIERYCQTCDIQVFGRIKYCTEHSKQRDWRKITIADIKSEASYQTSARIRQLARVVYRASDKPKQCCKCGYDKHYEVCHVHAIAEFPDDTPISVVNDIDNLIGLCPNCHWELDNGIK